MFFAISIVLSKLSNEDNRDVYEAFAFASYNPDQSRTVQSGKASYKVLL